MSKHEQGERPSDLHPEAMWPPRVRPVSPVVYGNPEDVSDASFRTNQVPEGGFAVRVGKLPATPKPRTDRTSDLPTEGDGAARQAIPAPEEAGTTGTIPAPAVTTTTQRPAPRAGAVSTPIATGGRGKAARSTKGSK